MKIAILLFGLLALPFSPARAAITYFYEMGGDFTRVDTITLTQTGPVFVQTGGNITTLNQSGPGVCYIYIDGAYAAEGDHSIRDASTTTTEAVYQAVLGPGNHTIQTSIASGAGSSSSYTYIRLENEAGPLDQTTINQITQLYQSADTALQTQLTTLIQNTAADLQNQIDAANASITQLQQDLAQQLTALQNTQANDEAAISALQQRISTDESAIAALQAQAGTQQNQLQILANAEAAHYATVEAQIGSLSTQVSTLNNTTVRKSNVNTYLLYGGAAVGAGGLGFGIYDAWFNRPDDPFSVVPNSDEAAAIPITTDEN